MPDLPQPGAPTGWPGGELERGIRRYQKTRGVAPDGVLLPLPEGGVGADGAGETLAALQAGLGGRLEGYDAPPPEEVDVFHDAHARNDADAPPCSTIVTPATAASDDTGQARHPVGVRTPASGRAPSAQGQPAMTKPGQQEAVLPAALVPAPAESFSDAALLCQPETGPDPFA
ncbi:MAG TPA: hypothetical protein VF194_04255 [Ferrovibrio sp.]|uniref:hypothetical protein n=1 Tax=Ferrovibrio sp. TaxID=1917215 RepID=UPI002ED2014E